MRPQGCPSGGLRPHVPAVVSRQLVSHMHPTHARAATNDCSKSIRISILTCISIAFSFVFVFVFTCVFTGRIASLYLHLYLRAFSFVSAFVFAFVFTGSKSAEAGRFFKYSLKKQSNCWRYFKNSDKHWIRTLISLRTRPN